MTKENTPCFSVLSAHPMRPKDTHLSHEMSPAMITVARLNTVLNLNSGQSFSGSLIWDTNARTLVITDESAPGGRTVVLSDAETPDLPDGVCLKEYVEGSGENRIDYRGLTAALLVSGVLKTVSGTKETARGPVTQVEPVFDLGAAAALDQPADSSPLAAVR